MTDLRKLAEEIGRGYFDLPERPSLNGLVAYLESALLQVREEAIEECAKIVDQIEFSFQTWGHVGGDPNPPKKIIDASFNLGEKIRSLKSKGEK